MPKGGSKQLQDSTEANSQPLLACLLMRAFCLSHELVGQATLSPHVWHRCTSSPENMRCDNHWWVALPNELLCSPGWTHTGCERELPHLLLQAAQQRLPYTKSARYGWRDSNDWQEGWFKCDAW